MLLGQGHKTTKHYFFILVHTFSIFLVNPSPTFLAHWNQATLETYKLHLSLSFVAGADAQPRPGRTQRLLQDSRYHYLSPSSVHATAPMQGMFQHFVFRQYCPRHLPGREPEKWLASVGGKFGVLKFCEEKVFPLFPNAGSWHCGNTRHQMARGRETLWETPWITQHLTASGLGIFGQFQRISSKGRWIQQVVPKSCNDVGLESVLMGTNYRGNVFNNGAWECSCQLLKTQCHTKKT